MLIKQPTKANDIIALVMSTGQEMLGRFESETDTHITIKKPVALVFQHQQDGTVGIDFQTPFVAFDPALNNDGVQISKSSVLCKFIPRKDLQDNYARVTSSIVPANTGII